MSNSILYLNLRPLPVKMFVLFTFALVQFCCVESRYVIVPSCQCNMNYVSSVPTAHRVEARQAAPAFSMKNDRYSHQYTAMPFNEQRTSSVLFQKNSPSCPSTRNVPEFHNQIPPCRSGHYPENFEAKLDIESVIYDFGDHEERHRRSVVADLEFRSPEIGKDDYVKYQEHWEDEESEHMKADDGEYGDMDLSPCLHLSDEERKTTVEESTRLADQKIEFGFVRSGVNSTKASQKYQEVPCVDSQEGLGNSENSEVKDNEQTDKVASKEAFRPEEHAHSKTSDAIKKKTRRSIRDEHMKYCYGPPDHSHCSFRDRYNRGNNYPYVDNQSPANADDCTISKNLFFGCDIEVENDDVKETQRKARKAPKTLTQKINELKNKNEKLKKNLKNKKPKKVNKADKIDNILKKEGALRNKRKENSQGDERTVDNECPCALEQNGACPCRLQNTFYPQQPTMYYRNPNGQLLYPVRTVYRPFTPITHRYVTPMTFHGHRR